MPYHLELGSEGRSFGGKAIVVNSKTGEHKSLHPIPRENAEAQMRLLERVAEKEDAPNPRRVIKVKKETLKEAEGQYWLSKIKEIYSHLKKGKVFKGHPWEDKDKSHTFYRVVDEARHSKYDQNYVMFEWNEKGITAANKDEKGHSIQNIDMDIKSSINEKINGKSVHLELQVAEPGSHWDTHMLIYFDEKINMNILSDVEVLALMRAIIMNKFGMKEVKAEPEAKKVHIPKIDALPSQMKKGMRDKLSGMEDTHEYTLGMGHPTKYILDWIEKFKQQEKYWGKDYSTALKFFQDVAKYVNEMTHDATSDGKPQKIILLKDWEKIF